MTFILQISQMAVRLNIGRQWQAMYFQEPWNDKLAVIHRAMVYCYTTVCRRSSICAVVRRRGFGGTEKKISIFYLFPGINTHFEGAHAAALGEQSRVRQSERRKEAGRSREQSKGQLEGKHSSSRATPAEQRKCRPRENKSVYFITSTIRIWRYRSLYVNFVLFLV